MAEPLRITVPVDAGLTAQNALDSLTLRERIRRKRAARNAGFRAWIDAGQPRFRQQVRVSAVVRRERALDALNLWGALKPIIDGVFVGRCEGRMLLRAMLPDDSERWLLPGTIRQETGREWRERAEVVIEVEAL